MSTAMALPTVRCRVRTRPEGGYFTREHDQGPVRALQRDRPRVASTTCSACSASSRLRRASYPTPLLHPAPKPARFGAIFYSSTSPAMIKALDLLAERGILVNALRVRAFPSRTRSSTSATRTRGCSSSNGIRDAQLKTLLVNDSNVDQEAGSSRCCITTVRPLRHASLPTRSRVMRPPTP